MLHDHHGRDGYGYFADGRVKMAVMTIRGICPHGKVRFMAVDEPAIVTAKVRKEIGRMVAAGFTIDRVTVEESRKSDMHCEPCDSLRRGKV